MDAAASMAVVGGMVFRPVPEPVYRVKPDAACPIEIRRADYGTDQLLLWRVDETEALMKAHPGLDLSADLSVKVLVPGSPRPRPGACGAGDG